MSIVRNITKIRNLGSVYKSPISWTRLMSTPTQPKEPKPIPSNSNSEPDINSDTRNPSYKPDNLEKRFLVWAGKYKSIEEVPQYIHTQTMERTRNKIRIKGANIMMVLTVLGCVAMVYSGKKAAKAGESVEKANLDWHKKYNETKE